MEVADDRKTIGRKKSGVKWRNNSI